MTFDWIDFLNRRGIAYENAGRSIRLECPFCPPNHRRLSINVSDNRGWWCWVGRHKHSGISPTRLVAAFLKCSYEQAARITGVAAGGIAPTADEFTERIDALRQGVDTAASQSEYPYWLPIFREIDDGPLQKPFVSYLEKRGFPDHQIMRLSQFYGIHSCLHGRWRYRLIFPIRLDGELVAFTARTIAKSHTIRYLAAGHPPNYLLWFDELKQGGNCIVLCEGPFDALKLRVLGQPATCFFTSGPSAMQIDFLRDLLPAYQRRILLLDRNSIGETMRTVADLSSIARIEPIYLTTRKDPGEISSREELRQILGI